MNPVSGAPLPAPVSGVQAVIKIENGIPVVYNPKEPAPPPGTPRSLTLKPDLAIGVESGDERYMFSSLRSIVVDSAGNIYVLDDKEYKIKAYDKSGKYLHEFGKKGKGPGEIEGPLRMELAPGDRIVVDDLPGGKLIFYSPAGICEKEVPLGKYQFMVRFKFDPQGFIYGDVRMNDQDKAASELRKFSPKFEPLLVLTSFEERRGGQVMSPYGRTLALQISSKGDIVWTFAETDEYEFTVVNRDGKILKKIVKAFDPVKIDSAHKAKLMEDYKDMPPNYRVDIPSHFPAFYYFIIDDKDRLYVCTYAYEERAGEDWLVYDVFDGEGRYIAKFSLPEREMAFAARNDKLYAMVRESAEGFPQVKRYAMIWK